MKLRNEDINAAVMAALALTNVEDDTIRIPMKHAAGALMLNELAKRIIRGEVVVHDRTAPPGTPPQEPPSIS